MDKPSNTISPLSPVVFSQFALSDSLSNVTGLTFDRAKVAPDKLFEDSSIL